MQNKVTTRAINSALRRAGLAVEIQNNRDGYSYFTNPEKGQVGESVYVCYLNQMSVADWVAQARYAIAQDSGR